LPSSSPFSATLLFSIPLVSVRSAAPLNSGSKKAKNSSGLAGFFITCQHHVTSSNTGRGTPKLVCENRCFAVFTLGDFDARVDHHRQECFKEETLTNASLPTDKNKEETLMHVSTTTDNNVSRKRLKRTCRSHQTRIGDFNARVDHHRHECFKEETLTNVSLPTDKRIKR